MDQHLNDFIRTSILGSNMQGKATIYLGFELCSLWFYFEEGSNNIWFDPTLTSEMERKPSLNFCRSHNSLWICLVQSNKSRWWCPMQSSQVNWKFMVMSARQGSSCRVNVKDGRYDIVTVSTETCQVQWMPPSTVFPCSRFGPNTCTERSNR